MPRPVHLLSLSIAALAGAAAIGAGLFFYRAQSLDAESQAYVNNAVPALAAAWNRDEFLERSTPELRASVDPFELDKILRTLALLGRMVEYSGASGESAMALPTSGGLGGTAAYVANVRFENGTAILKIDLQRRDGKWLISNFHADTVLTRRPENL